LVVHVVAVVVVVVIVIVAVAVVVVVVVVVGTVLKIPLNPQIRSINCSIMLVRGGRSNCRGALMKIMGSGRREQRVGRATIRRRILMLG